MTTKFPKLPKEDAHHWASFFHSGTEWLQALQLLQSSRDKVWIPYVELHILHFCLELFVKALASFHHPEFDAKVERLGHRTADIIEKYKFNVPIFDRISSDNQLMTLIREYQRTVDTRFGGTYIIADAIDANSMLATIRAVR